MQKSCQKQHFDRCLLWSSPPHYLQPSMFRTRLDNALTVGKNMSFLFKLQKVTKANFKKNPMQARPLDVYKQLPPRFRLCRSGRSFAQPLHHLQRSDHSFIFCTLSSSSAKIWSLFLFFLTKVLVSWHWHVVLLCIPDHCLSFVALEVRQVLLSLEN